MNGCLGGVVKAVEPDHVLVDLWFDDGDVRPTWILRSVFKGEPAQAGDAVELTWEDDKPVSAWVANEQAPGAPVIDEDDYMAWASEIDL